LIRSRRHAELFLTDFFMLLSIIVTNYKTSDLLKLCLESVKVAAKDFDFEILVVDSEAQEETGEVVRECLGAENSKLISFTKNQGFAKLVNAGLAQSRGEYLILFPDSLKKMLDYLADNKCIGMIGPQLLNFNGSVQDSCFRYYRFFTILYRRTLLGQTKKGKADLDRFLMKDFNREKAGEVDWLLGAALMVRRQALGEVGIMDERFFLYFEDVDWCRRFNDAGWKVVYLPEAKMHHYHGRGSKKSGALSDIFFNKYMWIHLASAAKYFWKYR
jgi:N-acetylglucosaminyl-diphospho-decaprenol L-rhamnosyltransferase